MKSASTPLAQGFLQFALLLTLQQGEMTGAELHFTLISIESPLQLSQPSVYRALALLRKRGAVYGARKPGNTRDVFYRITEAGRKEIWYREREWEGLLKSMQILLQKKKKTGR
jgi:DNA-binding PadR family transcriptional regulator